MSCLLLGAGLFMAELLSIFLIKTRTCLIFAFFNKNSCVMALFGVGGSGSYMKIRRTYKRNDQGDGLWIYQQNGGC